VESSIKAVLKGSSCYSFNMGYLNDVKFYMASFKKGLHLHILCIQIVAVYRIFLEVKNQGFFHLTILKQ